MPAARQQLIALVAASLVLIAAIVGIATGSADDVGSLAANAPKPGVYTFLETSDGEKTESTLEIEDKGSGRQIETTDDATSDVEWRKDGKLILETSFGEGLDCDWEPDIVEVKLPLSTGTTWRTEGRCEPSPGLEITISGTVRVIGTERRTVGGTTVDTWASHTNAKATFKTAQGSFEQKVTSEDRFAPAYGLNVYSVEKVEGTDPTSGRSTNETTTRELKSLTPK